MHDENLPNSEEEEGPETDRFEQGRKLIELRLRNACKVQRAFKVGASCSCAMDPGFQGIGPRVDASLLRKLRSSTPSSS